MKFKKISFSYFLINLITNIKYFSVVHVTSHLYSLTCDYSFLMKSLEDNNETIKNSMMEESNINKVHNVIQLKLKIAFLTRTKKFAFSFSTELGFQWNEAYLLNLLFHHNNLAVAIIKIGPLLVIKRMQF